MGSPDLPTARPFPRPGPSHGPALPTARPVPRPGPSHGSALPTARERFLLGFFTNMTNPKGIVFMVAVLPQFIDPQRALWLQLLVLMVTTVAIDVLVMHGYAFMASRAQRWLSSARSRRVQNRVFGGVLMAMGASLLMVKRVSQ